MTIWTRIFPLSENTQPDTVTSGMFSLACHTLSECQPTNLGILVRFAPILFLISKLLVFIGCYATLRYISSRSTRSTGSCRDTLSAFNIRVRDDLYLPHRYSTIAKHGVSTPSNLARRSAQPHLRLSLHHAKTNPVRTYWSSMKATKDRLSPPPPCSSSDVPSHKRRMSHAAVLFQHPLDFMVSKWHLLPTSKPL